MTARNYTFTWFDVSLDTIVIEGDEEIPPPWMPAEAGGCKYLLYQLEEAPDTHRRHLQGFVCFEKPVRFRQVQEFLPPTAHIEKMRGTVKQSIDYCSKQASKLAGPWHLGEEPAQGKRTDFEDLIESVQAGAAEKEIIAAHPGLLRYPGAVRKAQALFKPRRPSAVLFDDLKGWQLPFVDLLLHSEVKKRRIWWIWSAEYGTGKSTVAQYLICNHGAMRGAFDSMPNTLYMFNEDVHKMILFDIPRVLSPGDNDKLLEQLEAYSDGGYCVSTKYEPVEKFINCHILVFSNSSPPQRLTDRVFEVVASPIDLSDA